MRSTILKTCTSSLSFISAAASFCQSQSLTIPLLCSCALLRMLYWKKQRSFTPSDLEQWITTACWPMGYDRYAAPARAELSDRIEVRQQGFVLACPCIFLVPWCLSFFAVFLDSSLVVSAPTSTPGPLTIPRPSYESPWNAASCASPAFMSSIFCLLREHVLHHSRTLCSGSLHFLDVFAPPHTRMLMHLLTGCPRTRLWPRMGCEATRTRSREAAAPFKVAQPMTSCHSTLTLNSPTRRAVQR